MPLIMNMTKRALAENDISISPGCLERWDAATQYWNKNLLNDDLPQLSGLSGNASRRSVLLVHIGKAGGTTVTSLLPSPFGYVHVHPVPDIALSKHPRVVVSIRDPVARFVSAYNWGIQFRKRPGSAIARVDTTRCSSVNDFAQRFVEAKAGSRRLMNQTDACAELALGLTNSVPTHQAQGHFSHVAMDACFYLGGCTRKFAGSFVVTLEDMNVDLPALLQWLQVDQWLERPIPHTHPSTYSRVELRESSRNALEFALSDNYRLLNLVLSASLNKCNAAYCVTSKLPRLCRSAPSPSTATPAAGTSITATRPGTGRAPRRRVALIGPHDRFNFGDLIFEKVVSHMLVHRAGYLPTELVSVGMVSTNMSAYGGNPNIVSMKAMSEESRREAAGPHGPYDMIFLGGGTTNCNYHTGLQMMQNQALKMRADAEKIGFDCAYLIPKRMLLPAEWPRPGDAPAHPISALNSVGGGPRPRHPASSCYSVVREADHKSYRDGEWTASMPNEAMTAPDSAVMVSTLYNSTINQFAQEGEVAEVRAAMGGRYLAFQMREAMVDRTSANVLAAVLSRIAAAHKFGIVLFCAGTAPGHDSKDAYKMVQNLIPKTIKSHIIQTENVWTNIALISRASAILATSLHVRIMGFIFAKPRVTVWPGQQRRGSQHLRANPGFTSCPPSFPVDQPWLAGKQAAVIELWEEPWLTPNCTGDLARDISVAIAMHERDLPKLRERVQATQRWYTSNFDQIVSKLNK